MLLSLLNTIGLIAGIAYSIYLRYQVYKLEHCPEFLCVSRQGLERRNKKKKGYGIMYFDVNNMKYWNKALGYTRVDNIIKSGTRIKLRFGSYIARYYSGDEFIIFAPKQDLQGIMDRIIVEWNKEASQYNLGHFDAKYAIVDSLTPNAIEIAKKVALGTPDIEKVVSV